jgi:DDE family transposase
LFLFDLGYFKVKALAQIAEAEAYFLTRLNHQTTLSHAHLTLLGWNLFVTNVPGTIWTPATICKAYSLRWQVALVFKSWKSDLHLATLSTKTQEPTLCYLYGRLLLIVLTYALCPALRSSLWTRAHRELSFLKLVRYLQALAESWLQHLLAPPFMLHVFLQQLCLKAVRLVTKASRTRRTPAQRLRESVQTQTDPVTLTIKLAA